jgi:AcrR family transcriptional regulator
MAAQTAGRRHRRIPLNRARVLETAIGLADQGGLESLSMRKLGQQLGVEAMALYHHFEDKEDLVDAMVDIVFGEVELPSLGPDWTSAMRRRAISLRDALSRHRWAIGLMESRRHPGPAGLRHHDAMIGSLRSAGFDLTTVAHAYSALDSYIYGFALTKTNLPFETSEEVAEVAETMLAPFVPAEYPNLVEFIAGHAMQPGYDYETEFEYGLDVVLDGLERARNAPRPDRRTGTVRTSQGQ